MTDLPCPFCRGTDLVIDNITDGDEIPSAEHWFLCCETCGTTGPVVTRETEEQDADLLGGLAAAAWNERKIPE